MADILYDTHFYIIFRVNYIFDVIRDYPYWMIAGAHFLMFWLGEEIGNGCRKERDAVNAWTDEDEFPSPIDLLPDGSEEFDIF